MLETLARFLADGGPFMGLIGVVLAAAIAVIAERAFFYFRTCSSGADERVAEIARALNQGETEAARDALAERGAPFDVLAREALDRHLDGLSPTDVRRGVEEAALREVPRLGERLGYLAMLANVATLAGLLGTIFGLQHSFSSLAIADASEKAALLASGISIAMNTTAFGLMVAIPCMVAHAKLTSRREMLTADLDSAIVRLLHYFETRPDGSPTANGESSRAVPSVGERVGS